MKDKSIRCDQCGAEAWVVVEQICSTPKTDLEIPVPHSPMHRPELSFCSHDFNKNEMMLSFKGFRIKTDERYLINEKPSISANV